MSGWADASRDDIVADLLAYGKLVDETTSSSYRHRDCVMCADMVAVVYDQGVHWCEPCWREAHP